MTSRQTDEDKLSARRPRVTKALLEIALKGARDKNSYDWTVISLLQAMRLELPSNPAFRYEQRFRLYNEATKAAINAIDQVRRIIQSLPLSYQLEITNSQEYVTFDKKVLDLMKIKEGKQKSQEYDSLVFNHYTQMLFIGIRGVMSTMHPEFTDLLLHQLAPLLTTMKSVSAFERSVKPKTRAPPFTIPDDLLQISFNQTLTG